MTDTGSDSTATQTSSYGSLYSFLQATESKRLEGHCLRFTVRKDTPAKYTLRVHCGGITPLDHD